MKYSKEFDTNKSVKKVHFGENEILYMVPDGEGNYAFCSKNKKLQEWCENVEDIGFIKNKKVPQEQYMFAVGAAMDYMAGRSMGTSQKKLIRILAELPKGAVAPDGWEGCLFVDNGALSISTFDGLKNPDDIYRKSIENGHVDHHTIDMLPDMDKQPKKCSTQIVVDYTDEVARYCGENRVHEIQIHKDTDLDALSAAWLIREVMAKGELPAIANEMAEIVNKVDYAKYRKPVNEYVTSFPGCVEAMLSAIRADKKGAIYSNPANRGEDGRLTDAAFNELQKVDNEANAETLKVFDALATEKAKNPDFSLETANIRDFIEKSQLVSDYAKEQMREGLKQTAQAQKQFEEDIAKAKVVKFNFTNPETNRTETAQIVIVNSKDPLTTTNLGYAHYGKNTIMAVYGGVDRKGGDMYDIGIAPEAASTLGGVMKDICVIMNKNEASKRKQVERICDSLEQLAVRTPKETQRLSELRKSLDELASMGTRQAFKGAEEFGLIDKDPSPLVIGNTLVPASRHSLITEDTFRKTLTNWANKTRTNEIVLDNSNQR